MTLEVKQAARACFEAEAAGLSLAICIPEVVARDELMADERFQVRRDGEVVGCKCCCTTCGSNAFVLIGSINVNDKTRVRLCRRWSWWLRARGPMMCGRGSRRYRCKS